MFNFVYFYYRLKQNKGDYTIMVNIDHYGVVKGIFFKKDWLESDTLSSSINSEIEKKYDLC